VGWLINIAQNTIHLVLPLDTYVISALIDGFSPNQDKLLFGEQTDSDGKLVQWIYVLVLDTLETMILLANCNYVGREARAAKRETLV
jgi:hypothetical protein